MDTMHTGVALGRWLATCAICVLAACGGSDGKSLAILGIANDGTGNGATQEIAAFSATLTGTQHVPPTASLAQASGSATLDRSTRVLLAGITTSGIVGTAAHIRQAPPGANGPIVVSLTELSAGSGNWSTRTTLTDTQVAALLAGNMYFDVQSVDFPDGEIRGQILPQQSAVPSQPATGTPGTGTTGTGTTGVGTGTGGAGIGSIGSPLGGAPVTGTPFLSSPNPGTIGVPNPPAIVTPPVTGTGTTGTSTGTGSTGSMPSFGGTGAIGGTGSSGSTGIGSTGNSTDNSGSVTPAPTTGTGGAIGTLGTTGSNTGSSGSTSTDAAGAGATGTGGLTGGF